MAALFWASPASATVLCKTAGERCTGGTYGKETTIEASLKTGTKWTLNAGYKIFECEESTIAGEVTSPGGQTGASVTGTMTTLSFANCSIGTLKKGSFTINHSSGSNGTLTLEGFEIWAGDCGYGGPASTTLSGGATASIKVSASVPKIWGGEKCANPATITAEYTVTWPEPLYVASEVQATVLCKVAGKNPCPSESIYGEGQILALELGEASLFTFRNNGAPYLACNEVVIEGKITTKAGTGVDVGGPVEALSFSECSSKVEVLKNGSFSVDYTSGNNGTLSLEGFEVRDLVWGCTFVGPAPLPLWGGEMASATINSVVPNICSGPFSWNAEFTVTKPQPLYVSKF
jgi:hypothetical protein